jgi:hypothetical protein
MSGFMNSSNSEEKYDWKRDTLCRVFMHEQSYHINIFHRVRPTNVSSIFIAEKGEKKKQYGNHSASTKGDEEGIGS